MFVNFIQVEWRCYKDDLYGDCLDLTACASALRQARGRYLVVGADGALALLDHLGLR